MRFGRLMIGFLILIIGILVLGINLNWWTNDVWLNLAALWPLILIIIGIRLAFGDNNPVTIFLLMLIFLFGVIFIVDIRGLRTQYLPQTKQNFEERTFFLPLEKYERSEFKIDLGAAQLRIGALPPYNDKLYEGSFLSRFPITIENSADNSTAKIGFKEERRNFFFWESNNMPRKFNLDISPLKPVTIDLNTGASDYDFDLSNLLLENITVNSGASNGNLKIGDKKDQVTVDIKTGASDNTIHVPTGSALSITSNSSITDNNFDTLGLVKNDKTYQSPDYDSAAKKITITISAGASKFTIERY